MPAKKRPMSAGSSVVNFEFQERTYQIDPQRGKVYRRFVEIETSKAVEIYTLWRATHATA